MRHETKCGKTAEIRSSGVQELQNDFADQRFAAGREFLACASDSVANLRLLNSCNFFFSRSCTNVFSGIGIKLGDRSLFGGFFDIVNVIPNDLLRLRVVDHH
jgi:hypothetical protein